MQSRSDSELVALAQGGDREAFATLYDRWFDAVLSPDYNAAHRDHLHLDRGRYRACW